MTSKRKWQIYLEEREKGMTYAEIAAKYGVSHQAVAQTCARRSACHFKPYTEKECIYPNLRKWLNENRVMRNELARRMYGNPCSTYTTRFSCWFTGRCFPTKETIDKLLAITGLTYEQLWSTVESKAPAVDAVPVVRCRECIHYEDCVCLKIYSDGNASFHAWQERKEDDFCSYGERRDGNAAD